MKKIGLITVLMVLTWTTQAQIYVNGNEMTNKKYLSIELIRTDDFGKTGYEGKLDFSERYKPKILTYANSRKVYFSGFTELLNFMDTAGYEYLENIKQYSTIKKREITFCLFKKKN